MSDLLAWSTDLHLNFVDEDAGRTFARAVNAARPRAFVITGDTAESRSLATCLGWLAEEIDAPVYFVLGNHDFYRDAIPPVRALAAGLSARHPGLVYASAQPAVALAPGVGLVGVDGWGDARLGDALRSEVRLNDFRLIAELQGLDHWGLIARLKALGDAEAANLAPRLEAALAEFTSVLVITHVPPFAEACWHEGAPSAPDWMPFFTCKAVGDVLLAAAARHPDRRIRVLCGHTHSPGEARLRDNLEVWTGGARYGHPAFQLLPVEF
jgi:hypothetical protein